MQTKTCLITNQEFRTEDPDDNISPFAKDSLRHMIKTDKSLKKEVLTEIVHDDDLLDLLVSAMFSRPATTVGLSTVGSISEFFRKQRDGNFIS